MTTALRFLGRRVLEHIHFLIGLPIAIGLFVIVTFGWTSLFVPIFAVFLLVLLQVMQRVAWFEVKRANIFLTQKIRIIENWFSYPFFSWSGVRERFLSARSWLAIVYIVVNFVVGIVGFSLAMVGAALATALIGLPVGAVVAAATGRLDLGSSTLGLGFRDPGILQIDNPLGLPPVLVIVVGTLLIAAALVATSTLVWLVGKLHAHFVNVFLSNGYLPTLERLCRRATRKLRVSEKEVRQAIDDVPVTGGLGELSPREKEVLSLMAQGKSNTGIAQVLFITEGSVEKHVSNTLSKLNLPVDQDSHRRVQAVLTYLGIEAGSHTDTLDDPVGRP